MRGNDKLGYGLNSRNKRKKGLTSFGGDESNSDDDDNGAPSNSAPGHTTARSAINRDIAAEQAALRKRAKAAMSASSAMDTAVYDYDAEYDSFSSGKKKEEEAARLSAAAKMSGRNDQPKAKVQPRYITNLLQTAQRRNQEQEIIYERKVVKDQAEEDKELQYEGKEKFVTSSYKRKLAEREQWAKEEEDRVKREEAEDVTKQKKGVGSFMFGGIGRSMLQGSGGGGERKKVGDREENQVKEREDSRHQKMDDSGTSGESYRGDYQHRDSSRETEHWGSAKRNRDSRDEFSRRPPPPTSHSDRGINKEPVDAQDKIKTRQQILEERAVKIREARERYFKRRGVVTQ